MPATETQKKTIARVFIEQVHVGESQTAKVDMPELKAAAEAAYNWVEANQVSYNIALPSPFKTIADARQKAWLLAFAVRELVRAS